MATNRHYKHSELPTVAANADAEITEEQRRTLEMLYTEVCATWRSLVDVRFKLLGLVPFLTVAALLVLLPDANSAEKLISWKAGVVPAIGLLVTLGLLVYELRNSELYDDLISRGRRIEAELGIQTGVFRGRPKAKWPLVNHGTAVLLIYFAALAGWGFVLFSTI